MATVTWREVAEALAGRMVNHAFCPENHEPLQVDCPFCDDIAAYRMYAKKRGKVEQHVPRGKAITIDDVRKGNYV